MSPLRRPWGNAYICVTSVIADDTKLRPRGRAGHRGGLAMSAIPLMPKATAVWLVENTALSFDQVADFCKLHPLEVKAIADGDAAQGIKGLDPELKDSQIMRLVGTTKSTIQAIRERTHWNASNLQPMDPVTLGLCSQIDLDLEVHRAAKEKPVDVEAQGATLLPASETTVRREPEPEEKKKPADELNVDAVFAKLKQLGGKS